MDDLSKEDKEFAAMLAVTRWISNNRPELDAHLLKATFLVVEKDGNHLVSIAVPTSGRHQFFQFLVDLDADEIELVSTM